MHDYTRDPAPQPIEFIWRAQIWAQANGMIMTDLTIKTLDGREFPFRAVGFPMQSAAPKPEPAASAPPAPASAPPARTPAPSQAYVKKLLKVIPLHPEKGLTSRAVAHRANVGFNTYLRNALRVLVEKDYLVLDNKLYSQLPK